MAKVAKASKKPAKPSPKPAGKKPAAPSSSKHPESKKPMKATEQAKAPAKSSSKPTSKPAAKAPVKVAAAPPAVTPAPPPAPLPAAPIGGFGGDKNRPKGMGGSAPKPMKRPKPKKIVTMPSLGAPLLGPGGAKKWKPLIPSGPNAPTNDSLASNGAKDTKPKPIMSKKELDRWRQVLLRKRAELVGDVSMMEGEALTGSSGSLSHVPQHIAEQGSEAYEQALALDLAAVDRTLIKEIDDALHRVDDGTFGICELTGKPISKERLEELPWTRFSIEAARERERRSHRS